MPDEIIFGRGRGVFQLDRGEAQVSKPDFIASMIQFVDHSLQSQRAGEEAQADPPGKRRLSLADRAFKAGDDKPGPPRDR